MEDRAMTRRLRELEREALAPGRETTKTQSPGPSSAGSRLADAKDRSDVYHRVQQATASLPDQERAQRLQEIKERFSPGARAARTPGTVQGLTSLVNERIEQAMAAGQFRNLPRGTKQPMERDHNATSPFLDTTSYLLNKIIQKQDIVPPWIEKQQHLLRLTAAFRARLRSDWRRHAARVIASQGGSLSQQMRRAQEHAAAEEVVNPIARAKKQQDEAAHTASVGQEAPASQISPAGELMAPRARPATASDPDAAGIVQTDADGCAAESLSPALPPFRDSAWESAEAGYLSHSIAHLNMLTRSYNLLAPDLAKKPYLSLKRELDAAYADTAPLLVQTIRDKAWVSAPPVAVARDRNDTKDGMGVLKQFGAAAAVQVRDERIERRYGFRQLLRDLWGKG